MGASNYKEIIKGVLKSYSSLLLPVVIGLVGVLLFIPTQLMSNRLQKQIKRQSISKAAQLASSKDVVALDQWREEDKYQQDYETDANKIDLLAKQSTQRQLLSYEIFPEPAEDASVFIFDDFGGQFRSAVERLMQRVNAGDRPTKAELNKIQQSWKTKRSRGRGLLEVGAAIEDDLCREKAEAASVYINPADLAGYGFWGEYKYAKAGSKDEAIRNCWYSQLAYWIIEDVIDTIGAMDSGSDTVLTSPVKRLLGVSFSRIGVNPTLASVSKGPKKSEDCVPSYVVSVESGLTKPCTRRVSNDNIDVVHFKVAVVVGTEAVLPFMQKLCTAKEHKFNGWDDNGREQIFKHNQITILEYKIASVQREEDTTHHWYRYGKDAVVKLDLTCEYVFDKDGYAEVKPEAVKESVKKTLEEIQKRKQGRTVRRRSQRPTKSKTETGDDLESFRIRR